LIDRRTRILQFVEMSQDLVDLHPCRRRHRKLLVNPSCRVTNPLAMV
jgi:hypothetical protein